MDNFSEFYSCCICFQKFDSFADLEEHFARFHEVICPFCDEAFLSSVDVINHINKKHSETNHPCPFCNYVANDLTVLTYHVENDHHFFEEDTNRQRLNRKRKEKAGTTEVAKPIEINKNVFSYDSLKKKLDNLAANHGLEDSLAAAKKNLDSTFRSDDCAPRSQLYDEFIEQMTSPDDLGFSKTTGIIEVLRRARLPNLDVERIFAHSCDHFSSNIVYSGWACGYLNFQMLFSSLLTDPFYRNILISAGLRKIPSVFAIQDMIENAWRNGFDTDGANEFGNKLLGTTKWIGSVDIYTCLAYLGIKTELSDFKVSSEESVPFMFQWIMKHFENDNTQVHPLYLQHSGHSRTIVGVEKIGGFCTSLFLYDPAVSMVNMAKLKSNPEKNLNIIKKPADAFNKPVYQILRVRGTFKNAEELAI